MGGVSLVGNVKTILIVSSFIGFIFDLLYTQVTMKYAYRCQLNVYYLKIIKGDIDNYKNMNEGQANKNFQKEIMEKVGKADTFIKQLIVQAVLLLDLSFLLQDLQLQIVPLIYCAQKSLTFKLQQYY